MRTKKTIEISSMAISEQERAFFVTLGKRIAELRQTNSITQTELAKYLGISQQTINAYEVARRRVPVSALPVLAELFNISIDELVEGVKSQIHNKRGPASKLQQQMERLSNLPRSKQKFVIEMLDTVIQQQVS